MDSSVHWESELDCIRGDACIHGDWRWCSQPTSTVIIFILGNVLRAGIGEGLNIDQWCCYFGDLWGFCFGLACGIGICIGIGFSIGVGIGVGIFGGGCGLSTCAGLG